MSTQTRYMEYHDGSFMVDGLFVDKNNSSFTQLYGGALPRSCLQLSRNGNVEVCNSNGAVFCEVTLYQDAKICLNKDFLSSVSVDPDTELDIPSSVSKHVNYVQVFIS